MGLGGGHTQEAEYNVFLIVKHNSWRSLKTNKQTKPSQQTKMSSVSSALFWMSIFAAVMIPGVAPVANSRQDLINTLTINAPHPLPFKGQRSASIERSGTVVAQISQPHCFCSWHRCVRFHSWLKMNLLFLDSFKKISEKGFILDSKNQEYLLFFSSALCWILGGVCHTQVCDELPD